jgi:hypothetical protein
MELKFTRALLPGMFLDYDCVIIPGLGGFVCNERAAWYDEQKAEMVPPSRDVLFNPNLIHNDGLLAQEIIRATGFSYSEAIKIAEGEAATISEQLKNGKSVDISKVGRLYSSEDGVIRFTPNSELVRMLSSFGHSRIPLQQLKVAEKLPILPVQSTTKVIPLRVRIARVAAILAIPIAMGGAWMISEPDTTSTFLSVFPGIDAEAIISSFSPSESTPIQLQNNDFSDEELVIEYLPNPIVEVTTPILPTTSPVISEINFLIVVGAFSVEKNAYSFASKLTRDGFTVTHHFQTHNQLHLVVVGEFAEKAPARKELKKARKTAKVSAWLKTL